MHMIKKWGIELNLHFILPMKLLMKLIKSLPHDNNDCTDHLIPQCCQQLEEKIGKKWDIHKDL